MALIKYKPAIIEDPPRDLDDKKPDFSKIPHRILLGYGSIKDIAKLYPFKPETLK